MWFYFLYAKFNSLFLTNLKMISERSKRRKIISLVFILKCVSKKLLIDIASAKFFSHYGPAVRNAITLLEILIAHQLFVGTKDWMHLSQAPLWYKWYCLIISWPHCLIKTSRLSSWWVANLHDEWPHHETNDNTTVLFSQPLKRQASTAFSHGSTLVWSLQSIYQVQ